MEVYCANDFVKRGDYNIDYDGDYEDFGSSEVGDIEEAKIDKVVYYYLRGNYEGLGKAILKKGDEYFTASLGHCSCYGPTEDIEGELHDGSESIEGLFDGFSESHKQEFQPLVDYILYLNKVKETRKIKREQDKNNWIE